MGYNHLVAVLSVVVLFGVADGVDGMSAKHKRDMFTGIFGPNTYSSRSFSRTSSLTCPSEQFVVFLTANKNVKIGECNATLNGILENTRTRFLTASPVPGVSTCYNPEPEFGTPQCQTRQILGFPHNRICITAQTIRTTFYADYLCATTSSVRRLPDVWKPYYKCYAMRDFLGCYDMINAVSFATMNDDGWGNVEYTLSYNTSLDPFVVPYPHNFPREPDSYCGTDVVTIRHKKCSEAENAANKTICPNYCYYNWRVTTWGACQANCLQYGYSDGICYKIGDKYYYPVSVSFCSGVYNGLQPRQCGGGACPYGCAWVSTPWSYCATRYWPQTRTVVNDLYINRCNGPTCVWHVATQNNSCNELVFPTLTQVGLCTPEYPGYDVILSSSSILPGDGTSSGSFISASSTAPDIVSPSVTLSSQYNTQGGEAPKSTVDLIILVILALTMIV